MGIDESDIKKSLQEVDLDSLTLNIYGVVPTSNHSVYKCSFRIKSIKI